MLVSCRSTLALALAGAVALLAASPVQAGLFGPPKFKITQSDDRFSADGRSIVISSGNRISKRSIAGGIHIDNTGVFLDPGAVIDRKTGKLQSLTLAVTNLAERMGGLGEPNGLGRLIRVSFITGEGDPIVLEVVRAEQRYGEVYCNPYLPQCSTPLIETGIAPIGVEDYRRLMAATALAIKIDGSNRSHTYETADIQKSFIPNLVIFYNAHVAGAL